MSGITLDTKVRRTSNAASRDIAGEAIILSAKDSMLHYLDEVGTAIWGLLEEPKTGEEIVKDLLGRYEVEQGTLEKDVAEFLNELAGKNLIAPCSPEPES